MERQNNTDIDLGEKGGKKVFVCERKMERDRRKGAMESGKETFYE